MGALLFRGNVYGMLGENDKSILDFQKALEKSPKNLKAINGLALGYSRKGQNDLALENFIKAIEIEPENISVLYNLGVFYCVTGNYNQAINTLTKVINLDNTQAKAHYFLAVSYFNLSDYENATKYIDSVIKNDPSGDNYLIKSKILFNTGNKQEAISIAKDLLSQGFIIDKTYRNLLGI